MRRATVLFSSVVSLLISAGALAQEPPSEAAAPLAAAFKGAQHLAECTKALDAACVVALSDERSYWLWNGAKFDFAAKQARFYAAMQKRGYKYVAFDTVAPQKLYVDGGRLYTFIPYVSFFERGWPRHHHTQPPLGVISRRWRQLDVCQLRGGRDAGDNSPHRSEL